MIFRAPAGHQLLSKKELEKIKEYIESGGYSYAVDYLEYCLDEVRFYDDIRRQVEEKKMYQEEGDTLKAQSVENKMRERVRQRTEQSKLFKNKYLNERF